MSPSPESFGDTGKSRGWGIVTGTQRFWFSVLSVFSFNIWLLVWPRGLAVALSSSLPDRPHPCPKGRVHRDPELVLLFLQCLSTQTEFLDQALSYFSGEGGDLLASRTPWRPCGFISPPLQIVLWPLLHLCMQTFLTARHQVMQPQNRTPRLEGILEIIKSTSPKPSYKWEQGIVGREITCPKTPLVYVLLKARSCLGPGEISARRLLSGNT